MVDFGFVFVILVSLMAMTSKLKLVESRKYSRSSKVFERKHVFKWKYDKEDLLFHLFKGFISFK